jgi:L-ascorbate metabolism protein UlaG (beta-lactamase superfamily)
MKLTYYGHAAFLIETDDHLKLFVDPWITNPLSPVTGVDDIQEKIDYVLVTHDHEDHFGEALELADRNHAAIIGVYEIVKDLAVDTIPVNVGGRVKLSETTEIVVTPALHSSYKGVPVGYIILSSGKGRVYHAGDTAIFGDMKLYSELYGIEVALLPIGGRFTMDTESVLKALELLQPEKFVPMHYNTFDAIRVSEQQLQELAKRAESMGVEAIILEPGESLEL